jgi:hypothetical protein
MAWYNFAFIFADRNSFCLQYLAKLFGFTNEEMAQNMLESFVCRLTGLADWERMQLLKLRAGLGFV